MKEIDSNTALELLKADNDSILIDVRRTEEWDASRVDLSSLEKTPLLITINNDIDSFLEKLEDLIPSKNIAILFFCRSGGRSKTAALLAEENGYNNSYNVLGGILDWVGNNLPHTKSEDKNA